MMKVGAIAFLGLLLAAPSVRAEETPAFVNAAMCDVAAPIASDAAVFSRKIRAEIRPVRPARTRPARQPTAADAGRREGRAPVAEAPAADGTALLYPAVHFCVTPAGAANPVRYT